MSPRSLKADTLPWRWLSVFQHWSLSSHFWEVVCCSSDGPYPLINVTAGREGTASHLMVYPFVNVFDCLILHFLWSSSCIGDLFILLLSFGLSRMLVPSQGGIGMSLPHLFCSYSDIYLSSPCSPISLYSSGFVFFLEKLETSSGACMVNLVIRSSGVLEAVGMDCSSQ